MPRAGQLKANAWEAVLYDKGIGGGNGHARGTYIEDTAAIGSAELDVGAGGRSGAHVKAAVAWGMNGLNMNGFNRRVAFGVGCGCFRFCRCVHSLFCRCGRSLLRLIPLCDFQECSQLPAGLRKCVKDVGNILRAELKLASRKSQPDGVVDFLLLVFGKIVPQTGIEYAVLVIFSPLENGVETTTGVLLQFLFLRFRGGTFVEDLCLSVG